MNLPLKPVGQEPPAPDGGKTLGRGKGGKKRRRVYGQSETFTKRRFFLTDERKTRPSVGPKQGSGEGEPGKK